MLHFPLISGESYSLRLLLRRLILLPVAPLIHWKILLQSWFVSWTAYLPSPKAHRHLLPIPSQCLSFQAPLYPQWAWHSLERGGGECRMRKNGLYGPLSVLAERILPAKLLTIGLSNCTAPPTWLVVLPVSQHAAEEDRAWRDLCSGACMV